MRTFIGPRILGMLLLLAGAVALSYNVGVANGLAQAGTVAAAAPAAASHLLFGAPLFFGFFGFMFFGFLLTLLFIGSLVRLAIGFFFGHGPRGPWGRRGDWRGPREQDPSSWFEEWHRRVHESGPTVGPL